MLERIIKEREHIRKRKTTETQKETSDDRGEDRLKDFLDILLDVMENENLEIHLTRNHVKALVLEFCTGATDATAIAIEWVLAELINNPRVLEKVRKEI